MKLSIITPMYNSYKNMGRYFQNLENQTYKNFEIIIIDDCSTDDSFDKLIHYKENSELEIKVVKNSKNTGPGPARNLGIAEVEGNYITFVDSDDYLDQECFAEIMDTIKNDDVDCLIFDYFKKVNGNITSAPSIPRFPEGPVTKKEAIAISTGSTCCKVYKSDLILNNGIEFPSLMRFEDMVFNKLSLMHCNQIYYLKKTLYYYVDNGESIVNDSRNNNEKFVIEALEILEPKLKSKYNQELETIFVRELLYSSVLTMISRGKKNREIKKHIEKYSIKYPNWHENKNIKYFSSHQKLALKFIQYKILIGLRFLSFLRDRK